MSSRDSSSSAKAKWEISPSLKFVCLVCACVCEDWAELNCKMLKKASCINYTNVWKCKNQARPGFWILLFRICFMILKWFGTKIMTFVGMSAREMLNLHIQRVREEEEEDENGWWWFCEMCSNVTAAWPACLSVRPLVSLVCPSVLILVV